jgi:hypothetical protein
VRLRAALGCILVTLSMLEDLGLFPRRMGGVGAFSHSNPSFAVCAIRC